MYASLLGNLSAGAVEKQELQSPAPVVVVMEMRSSPLQLRGQADQQEVQAVHLRVRQVHQAVASWKPHPQLLLSHLPL
jgi:hypothetical protein